MIELVEDVPRGVFGVRAGGVVTPTEYQQVVLPALSAWLGSTTSLRVLAIVDDDFSYADGDWDAASDGVLRRPEWHRLGVVTGHGWVRRMAPVGRVFVPARLRTFRRHRLHHARHWVAAG